MAESYEQLEVQMHEMGFTFDAGQGRFIHPSMGAEGHVHRVSKIWSFATAEALAEFDSIWAVDPGMAMTWYVEVYIKAWLTVLEPAKPARAARRRSAKTAPQRVLDSPKASKQAKNAAREALAQKPKKRAKK